MKMKPKKAPEQIRTKSARDIVDLIKSIKGLKYKGQVAKELNMLPANLSTAISRNRIPEKHLFNFCVRENISLEYFLSPSEQHFRLPMDEESVLNFETVRIDMSNALVLNRIKHLKQLASDQDATQYLSVPDRQLYHLPEAPLIPLEAVIEFCHQREKISLKDFFSDAVQPILAKRNYLSPGTLSAMPKNSFFVLEMKERDVAFYAAVGHSRSIVSFFMICFQDVIFFVPFDKLLDLKEICGYIKGNEFFVQKGAWILQSLRFEKTFIRYGSGTFYPTERELTSFLALGARINKSHEVTALIRLAGLETYGAI